LVSPPIAARLRRHPAHPGESLAIGNGRNEIRFLEVVLKEARRVGPDPSGAVWDEFADDAITAWEAIINEESHR
jgi:hypothetical protein